MILNKNGDTILEVLLAIVVVSAALGGAFATMDRGTKGTRASHERAEALKITETQVELLKYNIKNNGSALKAPSLPAIFCIAENGAGGFDFKSTTDTPSQCSFGVIPNGYNVEINKSAPSGDVLFTVTTSWESVQGNNDRVVIKYKASL